MTSENAAFPAGTADSPSKSLSPFVWLALLAAIQLLSPFLPIPNLWAAISGGFALTLIYVAVVVALGLSIARRRLAFPSALLWLAVSVAVWLVIQYLWLPALGATFRALRETGTVPGNALRLQPLLAETLQDLALLGAAMLSGTLLARLIRHANMIGPIGAAIALIDIWGVLFGGIVSQLMTNQATQPLAEKAMAAGPKLGAASAARTGFSMPLPSIGVGDFLFIALLLSVLVNLSMNWRTSARLMWVFISLALLSFQFLPFVPVLPGLLFIGAAAVLPNWKYFTFTREERFALLYAGIFVLILTVGLYFGFKAILPAK